MGFKIKVHGDVVFETEEEPYMVDALMIGTYKVPVQFEQEEADIVLGYKTLNDAEVIAQKYDEFEEAVILDAGEAGTQEKEKLAKNAEEEQKRFEKEEQKGKEEEERQQKEEEEKRAKESNTDTDSDPREDKDEDDDDFSVESGSKPKATTTPVKKAGPVSSAAKKK